MAKIVVFNGGPRARGNTAAMVDAFIDGAKSAGNEVVRFDLALMDIHGCRGCLQGGKDPKNPCVQKDDMAKVYPDYMDADVVVFASPMYYWTISGQLQCAINRLYATAEVDWSLTKRPKAGVFLMAAEGYDFGPAVDYYTALMKHLGWRNLGMVCAGGNCNVGDIQHHPAQLEEARKLGASIH